MSEYLSKIRAFTSYDSFWKGYHYAKEGRAKVIKKLGEEHYLCEVMGTKEVPYQVDINIKKLKLSTCDCPYTQGHARRFCKHKVAAYFAIYPEELERVEKFHNEYEEQREAALMEYNELLSKAIDQVEERVEEKLSKLSPKEIREQLKTYLINEGIEFEKDYLDTQYAEYLDEEDF